MQPTMVATVATPEPTPGSEPTHLMPTARNTMGIFFPQQAPMPGRSVASGALTGRLTAVDGCLRVYRKEGNTSYLVVWPPDVTLRVENSDIQILNVAGRVLARVGDDISIGGGAIPTLADLKAIAQPIQQFPPDACPGPYWLASEARGIRTES